MLADVTKSALTKVCEKIPNFCRAMIYQGDDQMLGKSEHLSAFRPNVLVFSVPSALSLSFIRVFFQPNQHVDLVSDWALSSYQPSRANIFQFPLLKTGHRLLSPSGLIYCFSQAGAECTVCNSCQSVDLFAVCSGATFFAVPYMRRQEGVSWSWLDLGWCVSPWTQKNSPIPDHILVRYSSDFILTD